MSKKNRRKTLPARKETLPRAEFNTYDSKAYILATLIIFHIVPLVFVGLTFAMKQNLMSLYTQFAIYFNSSLLAVIAFLYGIKKGFNLKLPFFISVIAILSIVFYVEYMPSQALHMLFAFGLVYVLFSFIGILIGAYIKRVFKMD